MKSLLSIFVSFTLTISAGCKLGEGHENNEKTSNLQPIPEIYTAHNNQNEDVVPIYIEHTGTIENRVSTRHIDDNYTTPECIPLQWGTSYDLNFRIAGSACISFNTSSFTNAKYEVNISELEEDNNVDIQLLQWEEEAQGYIIRGGSFRAGNADERIISVGHEGHYVVNMWARSTTNEQFKFRGDIFNNPDIHEVNDFPNNAVSVQEGEYVTGALDNVKDQDFFTYTVPAGQDKIDVFASLQSWQTLLINVGGGADWQVLDDTITTTDEHQKTYDVTPGNTVTIVILQEPGNDTVLPLDNYRFRISEFNNIIKLTNHSVLSWNTITNNWQFHYLPYQNIDDKLGLKMKGAYDKIKFLGYLKGAKGPGSNKLFTFRYSLGNNSLISQNYYITAATNDAGWFEYVLNLRSSSEYKCHNRKNGYFNHTFPGSIQGNNFSYDVHRYSITSDNIYNEFDDEWIDDLQFFWLCGSGASDDYNYEY